MSDNIVEVEKTEDMVVLRTATEEVEIRRDDGVGDWVIHHFTTHGIGSPGGVNTRAQAIEYGLYVLGKLDETDVRPQDPYAGL